MSRTALRASQNIQLASVDDLFGLNESTHDIKNTIIKLPLCDLRDFCKHPFKVIPDDESMLELILSIRENGVLMPLDVRCREGSAYEIISGHRRKFAAEQAGLQMIPCMISDVDDDTAILRMVDSNLYRPNILPSEKAFAYKMKLDAMNRQGEKNLVTCDQVGHKLKGKKSREILAEQMGESGTQISRYIRLTSLSAELLEMVDLKKIPFNVGVTVSYLDEMQQIWLNEFISTLGFSPSLTQAEKMKKYYSEHKLTKEVMEVILSEESGTSPSISIKTKSIEKYFPPNTCKQEMEETILKLLDNWMNRRI